MIDYGELSEHYDRRYADRDFGAIERALPELVRPGERVLDAGCGTGYWLERLRRDGVHAFGLDASPPMLRRALARIGSGVFVAARAERLPLADACFDCVLAIQMLHHVSDRAAFLAEARRVLVPGGRFTSLGIDPSTGLDSWFVYDYFEGTRALDRRRHPSTPRIRRLLGEAGFTSCRTKLVGRMLMDRPARDLLRERALGRTSITQLALLPEESYRRGLARLEKDIAASEAAGRPLRARGRLHVYVTTAAVPGEP